MDGPQVAPIEVQGFAAPSVGFTGTPRFTSDIPITVGPVATPGNSILITPAPYTDASASVRPAARVELALNTTPVRAEAVGQTTVVQQAREQNPAVRPEQTTVVQQAREQNPGRPEQTTVIEQAREQNPNAKTEGAWNTAGVKADLAADTNAQRATLTGEDKPVIHVQRGDEPNNWPDNQTPDVVIKADGVHVREDLDTKGKSLKDLYVKVENGASEQTVNDFFLKDLNEMTAKKATLDLSGGKDLPKEVKDEYSGHDTAPPPTPTSTGQAGEGGGKPGPPPEPPPEVSKEEQERIKKLDEAERAKEQAAATGTSNENYADVTKRFDAKGGLADARSAAVGWCPPELQGAYASLLAGMHNPPTAEELAKLQAWLKEHKSEIDQHMDKNAAAMEAMGDKDGAGKLRDLKGNFSDPEWLSKQGEKDSFFGQSADAVNGNPVTNGDLGLGADTRAAIGHSHVVDEVAAEYHRANPTDKDTPIAEMFAKLSSDDAARAAMVADLQKIAATSDQSQRPAPTTNPQGLDLQSLLSGFPRG